MSFKIFIHVWILQINERKQKWNKVIGFLSRFLVKQKSTGFQGELHQRVFMDNLIDSSSFLCG